MAFELAKDVKIVHGILRGLVFAFFWPAAVKPTRSHQAVDWQRNSF
jgi:hypothetical protein